MRILVLLALVAATSACSVPVAEFTAVGIATPPGDRAIAPTTVTAVGHSCRWWIVGIPLGLPRLEDAIADALTPTDATALRNAELRSVHPIYGPIGRHCYVVAGRPASGAVARTPSENSNTR